MVEYENLLKVLRQQEVIGSAVIAKDGTVISSDILDETNIETFAIMMATIMGAAVTAAAELKKEPPRLVITESEDSKIILRSKGGKAFLVIIIPNGKDVKEILEKSEEILGVM